MNYLVMECRPAYAVVLGDDGTFLKVANMRYEVGQTVTDVVPLNLPETAAAPKTNHRRWISSLSALAACLVLVVTSVLFAGRMPYASVYMSINPEVRIDVNRRDDVVGVAGMNADGTVLLNGYDHKKKSLDTVMDELVDRAIHMGYLHEGGKITLSLDADAEWVIRHEPHLNKHLNEHLTDKITVTIDITPKEPAQAAPTAPTGIIVIPVGPDSYGDSDYGSDEESDYSQSDYGGTGAQSDYDDPNSDYASGDDGASEYEDLPDYGQPDDDRQAGHGDTSEDSSDYGTSDYEEAGSEYEASNYEDSDYEE